MADKSDTQGNQVGRFSDGKFHVLWRGRVVSEHGKIKRFETERDAREFLALCDALGKVATLD